jgi:hypothetical protein
MVDTATPPNKRSNVRSFVRRAQTREIEAYVLFQHTQYISPHLLHLFIQHEAWAPKFPILDLYCQNNCSSLNTCLIHIIVRPFEFREYTKENPRVKSVKI